MCRFPGAAKWLLGAVWKPCTVLWAVAVDLQLDFGCAVGSWWAALAAALLMYQSYVRIWSMARSGGSSTCSGGTAHPVACYEYFLFWQPKYPEVKPVSVA
jgi:hypothetical protein